MGKRKSSVHKYSDQNGPVSDTTVYKYDQSSEQTPASLVQGEHAEEHSGQGAAGPHGLSLTAEYQEQIRPFIDLIDNLRAFGLDQDVRLPAVAVIGDQSAGKSSALEAISGIQLPRGKGIVTRCPLVLRLKSTVKQEGQWRGHIEYTDANEEKIKKDIANPEDVTDYVHEAQNAIAGESKGISKKLITLDVESEGVPDLTLIDLPGITRIPVEGQPSNIGEEIKELITEQIGQQETIILAVVPANVDIATNEALQLASTFDPDGGRTLGVVTKPDLIDPGTESELLAVLNNESFPLEKGYTCVKCRGQQKLDDSQTLHEALEEEEKFFQRQKHFKDVDENILGVKNLSKKLTYELVKQIKRSIPELKTEVEGKTEDTRKRLDKLGAGLPEDKAQVTAYILRMLTSFTDHVKEECENALFKQARDMYTELMMNISQKSPDTTDAAFRKKVKDECVKNRGNELPRFMNYRVFKGLVVGVLDRYIIENSRCVDRVNRMMNTAITAMVDQEFSHLPKLAGEVKKKVSNVRERAYETCQDRLQEIIAMEKLVFTQDRIYNRDYESLKQESSGDQDEVEITAETKVSQTSHLTATISKARWMYDVDQDYEATIVDDMCDMIKAFIEVSNRRMVDYVPLTISLHLIENLWMGLRNEVPTMVTNVEVVEMAREENQIVAERRKLRLKLERLQLAHSELTAY